MPWELNGVDELGRDAIAFAGETEAVEDVVVDEEVGETTEDETTGTNVMEVLRLGMLGWEEGRDGSEDVLTVAEGRKED